MPSRWLRLFEEELSKEIDQAILTMTTGACPDYASYTKEVGKIDAFRRVLEIANEVEDRITKGD